ncbi:MULTISPECIES: hypothetical protein [Trichocoleus]|uniref:Uncharacterized protein n=1 Tax=Trichocoleus desertorum GB2-A4 TaxID=2933944 RepID=A0ABV0JG31_9CYAN|nr:hypothetical protein [Trichocoleus sp. FACHB-46]MBD1865184.1 hypothetical protein [Trichocoleus sp. FACHB-46]
MAVLILNIRNEVGQALTSIEGIPFSIAIQQGNKLAVQQTADLTYASATLVDVTPGQYIAIATHPRVEPVAAAFQFQVTSDEDLILILFVYLESERVLLNIETFVEP